MNYFWRFALLTLTIVHQSALGQGFSFDQIHSTVIPLGERSAASIVGVDYIDDDYYIFFDDTNAFATYDGELTHRTLRNVNPDIIGSVSKHGGSLFFASLYGGKLFVYSDSERLDDQNPRSIEVQKKRKTRWLNAFTSNGPLVFDGEKLYFITVEGSISYSEKETNRLFQKAHTLGSFDLNGKLIDQFGSPDTALGHAGLRWANRHSGVYDEKRDRFYLGNYLTPRIEVIYPSSGEAYSFGSLPEGFEYNFLKVLDRKSDYNLGYHAYLISFNFYVPVIDPTHDLLIRPFAKPMINEEIEQLIQHDYYSEALAEKGDQEDVCMAPNPIKERQLELLEEKVIYLQVYDLDTQALLGEIETGIKRSNTFIGVDQDGTYQFYHLEGDDLVIDSYKLNRLAD